MYITIVELRKYIKKAEKLLSNEERSELLYFLSTHPKAGTLLEGTGGIRKLRWAKDSKGKSGGVRIIYFYYNGGMPLFLLTLFAKNEKSNLSKAEKNELAKLTKVLIENYGGSK